jgi:hypothetical protein
MRPLPLPTETFTVSITAGDVVGGSAVGLEVWTVDGTSTVRGYVGGGRLVSMKGDELGGGGTTGLFDDVVPPWALLLSQCAMMIAITATTTPITVAIAPTFPQLVSS